MNLVAIYAGILGTFIMTLFVEFTAYISRKPFHVVSILCSMLTFGEEMSTTNKRVIYLVALLVHYSIGVIFSYCFELCLDYNLLALNLSNVLIFGGIAGLIGITGWRTFFAIHPSPPKINLSQYLTIIWIGHILYATGVFWTYLTLSSKPVEAFIPIC